MRRFEMDRTELLDVLCDVARPIALEHYRTPLQVENKWVSGFDPVTIADREIEERMRGILEEHVPEDAILGEEFGFKPGTTGYQWIIDPIDGTRSYITGRPTWGILVALQHHGRSIAGVMDQPYIDERFIARDGEATVNHQGTVRGMRTRRCSSLEEAVVLLPRFEYMPNVKRPVAEHLMRICKLPRTIGDCYSYMLLATGGVDLIIETWDLEPYDIQPIIPIVEAAGGIITTWDGEEVRAGGHIIAAGDPSLHQAALQLVRDLVEPGERSD